MFSGYSILNRRTVFQYEDDHVGSYTTPMSAGVAAKVEILPWIFIYLKLLRSIVPSVHLMHAHILFISITVAKSLRAP
jgi:hypothetical protein